MSKLLGGMVIVAEGGFVATMSFMKEIQLRGIEHDLKGWWWSSDKGLIQDPEDSDEIVVKAQTMYDALTGKPVYVNGVRMFQSHTPQEIRQLLDVNRVDLLQLGEPPIKKIEQPEEISSPALVEEGSFNYETAVPLPPRIIQESAVVSWFWVGVTVLVIFVLVLMVVWVNR